MLRFFNTGFPPEGFAPATRESFVEMSSHLGGDPALTRTLPISSVESSAVIKFWLEAGPTEWFAQRPAFDRSFRDRFLSLHERVARAVAGYATTSDGSLALLVLLDQFPRNAFRGTPRMYATDELARDIAKAALDARHDQAFDAALRPFFYLPFAHSENLADQERSVALSEALPEPNPSHARRHRDIISRFGRFPHRNPILGRTMTPAEQSFLDEGGYRG